MDVEQLVNALSDVNINSESAVQIAEMYIKYQYTEMFVLAAVIVFFLTCLVSVFIYGIKNG